MRPNRVLLVDGEVAFLEVFSERLQSRGLEVSAVTSGEEAVPLANTKTFDAIVLDLAMPGMDGLQTLRQLLAVQPHRQVMILTGQATLQAAVEATRLGAVDIFEKPTDIETLLARSRLARAKRLALEERHTEAEISEILRTRGW